MANHIETPVLVIIALLAVCVILIATVRTVAPAAIASEIGDQLRASPDSDGYSIAYEILTNKLEPYFRWLQLLGVGIFVCAVTCLSTRYAKCRNDHKRFDERYDKPKQTPRADD
jgi:hypothetical protein